MADIGSAYLTIFPSMSGFGKELTGYLNGVDLSGAGQRMGSSLSKSISAQVSDVGLKGLEDAVVKAEMKVRSAMDKSADAAKELEIAQKRLSEARAKYPADSSQVAQAELRVQQAQRKSAAAAKEVDNAQGQLAHAQKELEAATESSTSALRAQDGAMDSLGGSSNGLSGKLSAITGAAIGVAAELAGRLFDAVLDLGSEMVEASDSAQKFASTLSFAGIDDSTIQQLTASTQEYADQTVYDLADIRNATAQLAANGVNDYAQLAEAAGNLNAVAGGSSDTFKSVSMVMSQTAGQGKLVTENWNQLTDAIPGASGALQQAMADAGAFEGNFREAMENGEISADEFFAAVQKLGMTDVAKEAATSTSTIEGAMGNLVASVVGVGSQVITELNPIITGAMNLMTDAISGIPTLLSTYGPMLASFFEPLVTGARVAADFAVPAIQGLASAVTPLATTLGTMFQPVLSAVVTLVGRAVMALGQLAAVLAPIIEQVVSFVTTQLLPVVQPAIAAVVSTVQTAMPLITSAISIALTTIQAVWDTVWPHIQAVVMPIVQTISTNIQNAMAVIQAVISTVMAAINGDWSAVWAGIQQVAQSVWDSIVGSIDGCLGSIQAAIDGALSAIKGIWEGAWDALGSFLDNAWNGFVRSVSGGNEQVMSLLGNLPSRIIGVFSGVGSWLIDSGRALLDGFIGGIRSGFDAAVGAIESGLSWIRGFFPFSPAKRGPFSGHGYTTYSGKALMEDWGKGIASAGSSAVSSVLGVMGSVSEAMELSAPSLGIASTARMSYAYGRGAASTDGQTPIEITGNTFYVRDDSDIEKVARQLYVLGQRRAMAW